MSCRFQACCVALAIGLCVTPVRTPAAELVNTGTVTLTWDNTVRLGGVYQIASDPGASSGKPAPAFLHRSADEGLVSGRIDWLSGINLDDGDFGMRVSAAGWYDGRGTYFDPGRPIFVYYPQSPRGSYLLTAPALLPRRDLEVSDAFMHGAVNLGTQSRVSFRLGRHVLLWGDSLYFPEAGIAAGQAPIDTNRAHLNSTYDLHDLYRPVGQFSGSWQPRPNLAVDFYEQFEFRPDRLEIDNDYGDIAPLIGPAAARLLASFAGARPQAFTRSAVERPDGAGQFGAAVKFQTGDTDWGIYARRFDSKMPIYALHAGQGGAVAPYTVFYPAGVQLFGASVATTMGGVNVGAELSGRRRMPFVAPVVVVATGARTGDAYPRGNTLNLLLSWSWQTPPVALLPSGAKWSGEIAMDRGVGSIANAGQVLAGRTATAAAVKTVLEPQFYQVLPRLDISMPISLDYGLFGRSESNPVLNRGTGTVGVGVSARFDEVWLGSVNYTHYIGTPPFGLVPYLAEGGMGATYGDLIALSVRRSF